MTTHTGPGPAATVAAGLRDAPMALEIPTDHARPTTLPPDLARAATRLGGDVVSRLDELASTTESDRYTVLLAAWLVVLHRTTDEADLVVGCGGHAAVSRDDGLLVLRQRVDAGAGFDEVVRATHTTLLRAVEQGEVSLSGLLTALSVEPGSGKHPVYQIGYARLSAPEASAWPPSGDWPVPPDAVLAWSEDEDGLVCRIDYAAGLFDAERVVRLLGHLTELLSSALGAPTEPVAGLRLLSPAEVAELRSWNATSYEHDAETTLAARFRAQARRTPAAVAVEHLGVAMSYAELETRADRLAHVLVDRGVGPDVTVAVCAERSPDMVVGVLAVLLAGGAYVPVDPAYPQSRRTWMVEDSGAKVVLTQRALSGAFDAGPGVDLLMLDDGRLTSATPSEPVVTPGSGADLAYVIYTSGSTGKPKGVALTQSALGNLVQWQLRRPQAVPQARTLQFSSLSFDVSFQEIFTTWCSGGTLVLVADATRRDPLSLLAFLTEHRITRLFLPYVALRGLAAAVMTTGRVPEDLREIYTAGEQLQADPALRRLLRALPDCRLENQYGPSESHVVTAHTLDAAPDRWPALPPIGRPIDNSEVHVLDARQQLRPVGVPGELYLGGACLARGYLGRPDLTAERFVERELPTGDARRLYRTGDLARWLPDGTLEFLGRTDHQVKFRGYRIEPGEIGAVLSGAPGVSQCVAVVRDNDGTGTRLTAYLLASRDEGVDVGAVHAFAREHLPAHMVPSHYLPLDHLPLTPSGKVDTQALPDVAFDRGILSSPYVEPSTTDELVLTAIWQRLLGVPEIGVDDDFFELGGDSLMGAEMVELISSQLGVEVPLGALAQGPTIARLAAELRQGSTAVWRSLVPLQTQGGRRPLFVVHGGSGNVATFPRLARALPADQPVYALQWDGLDGSRGRRTVEAMATHYLGEVRSVQAQGPYLLAGQCIGGLVAREMARQLLEQGEEVQLLVMYDSPNLASEDYVAEPPPTRWQALKAPDGRRAKLEILVRNTLRARVPVRYRPRHGELAMVDAAWEHRPRPLPRPVMTHYVGSGESDARALGLAGSWTDGAMGWASSTSDFFVVHRIDGEHNEVLYSPEALALLRRELERCQSALSHAV